MVTLAVGALLRGQDDGARWPQFRGPFARGVGAGPPVPTSWDLESGENAAPCSAGLVLFPTVGWFLFVAPRLTALGMLTTIALSLLVGAGRCARAPSRARRRHTNPAFSRLNRALARDPDGAGGLLVASLAFLLLAMFTEVRAGSRGARARDRI